MVRTLAFRALTVLAGVVGLIGPTPDASAQLLPGGFRPGFYYSSPFGNFAFNSTYQFAYRYSFVNPYNGINYSYGFNSVYSGFPLGGGPAYSPYMNPYYHNPYSASAYAGSNPGANPVIQQQLRMFAGAANPANANAAPAGKGNDPAWAPKAKLPAINPADLDPSLLTARDADILSGKVLNDLAGAIRLREAKGVKADSALLPPELLTRMAYQDGAASAVLTLGTTGAVSFPWPLTRTEFGQIRADLEPAANAVLEPLALGKRVDAASADRLTAAVGKTRTAVAPILRGIASDDAAQVNRFLDQLATLALAVKDPSMAGVVVPKWNQVGTTVGELLKHLDKFKVRFGPAPTGSEEAYQALYRGLVAYYASLSPTKS